MTGRVIETVPRGRGSVEARISFEFDQVRFGDRNIPINAGLIALASVMEVDAAQVPASGGSEDYSGNGSLVQIGGDEVSYGQYGPVLLGTEVVGNYTPQGVLANAGKATKGDNMAQAYWLFSVNASGVYGFRGMQIQRTGGARPGEVTLTSNRKVLKVGKGSAMLLRVVGGEPEATQSGASLPTGRLRRIDLVSSGSPQSFFFSKPLVFFVLQCDLALLALLLQFFAKGRQTCFRVCGMANGILLCRDARS